MFEEVLTMLHEKFFIYVIHFIFDICYLFCLRVILTLFVHHSAFIGIVFYAQSFPSVLKKGSKLDIGRIVFRECSIILRLNLPIHFIFLLSYPICFAAF